jgi:hypothetical protein
MPFILTPSDNTLVWTNFLKSPTVPMIADVELPPPAYFYWMRLLGWVGIVLVTALAIRQGLVMLRRGKARRRSLANTAILLALCVAILVTCRGVVISADRAQGIMSKLLGNVYVAFDHRQEDRIYEILNKSVSGDLLTQIYLETKKSLELASQGGARVKVKEVDMLSVQPESLGGEAGFRARCKWNVSGSVGHWGHIHKRTNQYEAEITVRPVDGSWKITNLEILQEERLS